VNRRLLLLGGIDPCGGAGITADAVVSMSHGVQPLPIAIALTVQNRHRFRECHPVTAAQWRAALSAALDDGPVHAVKTGLLGSVGAIEAVAAALRGVPAPLVVDPVLSATAGGFDAAIEVAAAYRELLAPLATLLTPNGPELQAIAGGDPSRLLAAGCGAVLHKGGHGAGALAEDVLHVRGATQTFGRPRLSTGPVHGTGCALSTAIAARLALGESLTSACRAAGDWLHRLLQALGPGDALPRPLPLLSEPPIRGTSSR
jgi:hydroxymethylpyrimidine/phosphomethylpyrimidine kinase